MKSIFVYIFLLYCFISYSQNKKGDIKVEYKKFCDTNIPLTYYGVLCVHDNVSIYQDKLSTTERWVEKPSKSNADVRKPSTVMEPYLKINPAKKEMLFFSNIMQNTFLVKDNYNELAWNISEDTTTIAGYKCTKATTSYRGRDWVVWFTADIPMPFGPWKLHGLPGLILEANDSTNTFAYKVTKIEFSKADVFDKDFNTLIATKNSVPISYKQYFENMEEEAENRNKKSEKDFNASIVTIKAPRGGMELKYEWEQ